jgi:hypothetical protein
MMIRGSFLKVPRAGGGWWKYSTGFLCLMTVIILFSESGLGYIMPAEQIIQFMAARFSKFETVIMDREIEGGDPGNTAPARVFQQRIWLKSPGYYHVEWKGEGPHGTGEKDHHYWQLLIANRENRLRRLLSDMGVNLEVVAFTRVDGIIAYRIGNKGPTRPKLLVEKERFLPIVLFYRVPGGTADNMVRIEFRDYREVEQGWYPFEVTFASGSEIRQKGTTISLQANAPVDPSLFDPAGEKPYPVEAPKEMESPPEEERLKRIIKAFEEKYH